MFDAARFRRERPLRVAHALRRRVEGVGLLLAILASAALWVFVELADYVVEGETAELDRAIVLALRTPGAPGDPLGPLWLEEMGRDFTALGGIGVLGLVAAAASTLLWLQGNRRTACFVAAAVASGLVASLLLKSAFDRPRPELVPRLSYVHTASFPSGHSMMSALTYLTLAALLARHQPARRVKIFLMGLAGLITLLVGVSRVYLGVHWPTDVLAGWALGAAWALGSLLVARALARRGRLEHETPEVPAPRSRASGS